jgi:GNAT superfamily N-acetyltransferase
VFIIDLADRPEGVGMLAEWLRNEWEGVYGGRTQREVEEALEARLHRNRLPITMLAIEGDDVIGAVSLVEVSLPTHAHLGPWIGGLYVVPERRGSGVATSLVGAAVERAGHIGYDKLYMAVAAAAGHYQLLGWIPIDQVDVGKGVSVLMRELTIEVVAPADLTSAMPSRSSHTP